jgi:hypothetical protein
MVDEEAYQVGLVQVLIGIYSPLLRGRDGIV